MSRYREIISYPDMVQREGIALQKGMNFRVRKGAPYQDQWHDTGRCAGMLEYEGHDVPRYRGSRIDPKVVDQPMRLPSGALTENGKFFEAAQAAKRNEQLPEIIQVYEKISAGIWCDRGRHLLLDAEIKSVPAEKIRRTRKVFRFFLSPTSTPSVATPEGERELQISRLIPTPVKVAVWKRDSGRCVQCGANDNLHFDHDVLFSKGGSSITVANVKLLCARHNLEKSDRILSIGPWLVPLVATAIGSMVRGA